LKVYLSLTALKPDTPVLTHAVDISAYFSDTDPFIGFQAASSAYGADFAILSWSFESIAPATCPEDTLAPSGALHAYPNLIWPPNNKMVNVNLSGYVMDEMSIAREGDEIGISSAYLLIDDTDQIILLDDTTDLLDANGHFSVDIEVKASKGAEYMIELYASDTKPDEPNSGIVDKTFIRVPHNIDGGY